MCDYNVVKNAVSAFQISCKLLSFGLEDLLADDQCSLITKDSIYHIKHMSIQTFTMGMDWPDIASLMEVSIMFTVCRYSDFTWYGRIVRHSLANVYHHSFTCALSLPTENIGLISATYV